MVDLIKKHWKIGLVFGIELILVIIFITQIQNLITPVSAYGELWIEATSSAQWAGRADHASVFFDNKIWVIGGFALASKNDVWYSTNGISWTQATDTAQWSARYNHTSVAFNNKIWVTGGNFKNDVWYSTNGVSWTQATNTAQWSARERHTSVVFDNKIWVIGGNDSGVRKNDVWYSTNGISWTQATDTAQWSARQDHASVSFDNKIWVIGGDDGGFKNDVWYSTSGISWIQATPAAQWSARDSHASVLFDNKIWVIGGVDAGAFKNDVWYLGNPVIKEFEVTAVVSAWLSFSVSPTTTPLSPNLVDTGGGLHYGSSTNVTLNVGTNAANGWNVTIQGKYGGICHSTATGTACATTTDNLIASVATGTPTALDITPPGSDGYGANATPTASGVTVDTYYDDWGTQTVGAIASSTSQLLASKGNANASQDVALLKIFATSQQAQKSGTYYDTVTLTATSVP